MKKLIIPILLLLFVNVSIQAQENNLPAIDKSPMDMSYYPNNYPVLKIQDKITESLVARVVYSRPQKMGRTIFGGLVEYGKVWRMGANEATEIQFFRNVHIGGKRIVKGRYTLYALVNEDSWTMIISKETDTWGSFKYDPKKDLIRSTVHVQRSGTGIESLAMVFEKTTEGCNLIIAWENVKVALPVIF